MHLRRLTSEFKTMREAGASLEGALTLLRSKGASIAECIIAVKEETGCELGEAKRIVHQSKTWRDIAEATDLMWEELIAGLEKERPNQPQSECGLMARIAHLERSPEDHDPI